MSGASNWLKAQRKAELIELADTVGLEDYDGMKKTELEVALDDYLSTNASRFSNDSRFTPFYKRRSDGSPIKKEASAAVSETEGKVKQLKRRTTKLAEEISNSIAGATSDESEPEPATTRSRSALIRTPRASTLAFASNVPLPPSPSVVADAITHQTNILTTKVSRAYEESGVVEKAQAAREILSTVVAVEFLISAVEAYQLRKEILADRYAFTIPAISLLHTSAYSVKLPDLFLLLTSSFWGPATLWAFTSLFIPLTAAYFFNLTSKPKTRSTTSSFNYTFDPLTFNIVKALLAAVVYGQDYTFGGLVDSEYVARINSSLYGGYQSVLVGTGIGALVTLYDAVLKK